VRNLQVRTPLNPEPLKDLAARMDVVFIDAPCSGTGSWRRHPDTKWRLTPETLAKRQADQDQVLDDGSGFVKPGGRMVYVTCSVLPEEDEDRVAAFLARHPGFARKPAAAAPSLRNSSPPTAICASRPEPPAPTASMSPCSRKPANGAP
jgi:16S rRNA (cytosine967-C5)-methyltransferase